MAAQVETNGRSPIKIVLGPPNYDLRAGTIIRLAEIVGFTETAWVGVAGTEWTRVGAAQPHDNEVGPHDISPEADQVLCCHFGLFHNCRPVKVAAK